MAYIVGHRGAAGYAAENSLESFAKAISIGCQRAELDVQLTKDNALIVFHDDEISRVTNGKGKISELTFDELRRFTLPNGETIPTLQEVIDVCKGKIVLQIELKGEGTAQPTNESILRNDIVDQVVVTSFDSGRLREIKAMNPRLRVGLLFEEYSETLWELVREVPLDFIAPKGSIVTENMVRKAHSLGLLVYAFHVQDNVLGEKLIALGVDEIGTDFPKLFLS